MCNDAMPFILVGLAFFMAVVHNFLANRVCFNTLRSENLIISESMTQDFGFTVTLGKQTHSRLRNCFSSVAVESKDKSDSEIIEISLLCHSF